jgi:biopolymer transport protein ExbD
MKRRPRRQRLVAEINITPFTDVILVLLIIFMIITPLISKMSVKVSLPSSSYSQPASTRNTTYVVITEEGKTYVNDELVSSDVLKDKMRSLRESDATASVVLLSDKSSKFEYVVAVLDLLHEVGINDLSIGTVTKQKERQAH